MWNVQSVVLVLISVHTEFMILLKIEVALPLHRLMIIP